MAKYQVYADTTHDSEHCGLVGACTHARREATARPGVVFVVELDGREIYNARVGGGKLKAWML